MKVWIMAMMMVTILLNLNVWGSVHFIIESVLHVLKLEIASYGAAESNFPPINHERTRFGDKIPHRKQEFHEWLILNITLPCPSLNHHVTPRVCLSAYFYNATFLRDSSKPLKAFFFSSTCAAALPIEFVSNRRWWFSTFPNIRDSKTHKFFL